MAGEVPTDTTIGEEALQGSFKAFGNVLRPGDPATTTPVRSGTGSSTEPALIVQPTDAADVVDAVNFSRVSTSALSIKGGAHNVAGNAVNDDGIVIDLSKMRGVHVDPAAQTVRAQGKRDLGRLRPGDAALRARRAGRVVSTTGIAGLTLQRRGHLRRSTVSPSTTCSRSTS